MSCKTRFEIRKLGHIYPRTISIPLFFLIVERYIQLHGKPPGSSRTSRLRKKFIKAVLNTYLGEFE